MAEVAPSGSGGSGNRNFLMIIGGLAALLVIGLLVLGAVVILPGLLGGQQIAGAPTATATRIVIPNTATRTALPPPTLVVVDRGTPVPLGPGERRIQLEMDANSNVTLTSFEGGKAPLVQKGKWSLDAASNEIRLLFTELNGKPFKDSIVVRVQNGGLSAVSYNRALHGDLGAVEIKRVDSPINYLAPAKGGLARPQAQATATPDPVTGDYTGTLPGPTDNERLTILVLSGDALAVLNTAESGKDSVLQLGTWAASGNTITVTLTDMDGSTFQDKLVLTLQGTNLVGAEYDQVLHGSNLVLQRDPASPILSAAPAAGTYTQRVSLAATVTPIPITATPVFITATPEASTGTTDKGGQLPDSGVGEDLLLLFGGGILLLGVIVIVRRMRAT